MPVVCVYNNGGAGPGATAWRQDPRWAAEQLEQGNILVLDEYPFEIPAPDLQYLLAQRQDDSRLHKNISYRPIEDVLRGTSRGAQTEEIKRIMREYSRRVTGFLTGLLSPYAGKWSLDFASFRPIEEAGRNLPLRKRNDLLHVDAFPTRPTRGARILRIFTNINPVAPRVWNTTDSFDKLARQFAMDAGLGRIASGPAGFARFVKRLGNAFGARNSRRSAYDRFMLRFHNYLKENHEFQTGCEKVRIEFAPGATWIAFTDAVAHAVLSGQFALEQTYIIPREALVMPEKAPVSVLEKICGANLAH